MRQVIKTPEGELTYGSMAEVKVLYAQGFIHADDLIRAANSERWVACGSLRVLAEAESRGRTETAMGLRVALAIAISMVLGGAVEHQRWLWLAGLVGMGVLLSFTAYRRKR